MDKRELLIKNCFNSWIEKDSIVFRNSFADDAVYVESWGPAYRNIEHIMAWFNDWNKENHVLQWDIKEFFHFGNICICEWYFKCDCNNVVAGFDGVSIINFNETGKIRLIKEFQSKTPNNYPYERIITRKY